MTDHKTMEFLYRWRVRAGTIGLGIVLLLARPAWKTLAAGFILSLCGLGLRALASGHLRKEKELTVSGPYKYTRNPLYLGNLILGAGMAVGSWSWGVLAFLVAYFLIFYPAVICKERERMRNLFPEGYRVYEKSVPLFFPLGKRGGEVQDHPFSRALYKKNKELRALLGTMIFWGLMIAKMIIVPNTIP